MTGWKTTRFTTTRRGFLAAGGAVGAAAMLPKWVGPAQAAERVLNLRLDADNAILDPGYMVGGSEIEAQKQCLPFLAQYVVEDGAVGWEPTYFVSKLEQRDPTHIDFELAEGLMWSGDFGPVLASDVKYSYERMKTTDWSGYFDAFERVDVTGERSGTIVLNKPFAPFIVITLCHGPGAVLSEKAMMAVGEKFTTEFPAICGPYVYEQIPGQRAVFTPNPDWTGPKPDFDRVNCNVITEMKGAELAFEAGELHCTEIGTDTLARYADEMPAGAKVTAAGELQYLWLGMNTQHPKLQNKLVRRAIQHAVDVEAINQGAYSGVVTRSYGNVCPGLIGQRTTTRYYTHDVAKARELLEESGVRGLELTLKVLNNQERMLGAQIIQANLAAIGITVKILPQDAGPFWEMGQESKGEQWKDLELFTMRFATTPDPYEAMQWFVSSQVGVWNWERWTDPEFDRLYEEGLGETDPAKRAEIYLRMQDIMEETGAYVWINHEPEVYVHADDVEISAAPSAELDYRRFRQL
ncbi:MAG: ABC transporter substrate-binding protein [Marivibrio sp.]|uniref:ABC transporter substrate-binding protein n=1 Tax=Marivibrio sp. TaxID=2039719 RepID=UPI0032EEE965